MLSIPIFEVKNKLTHFLHMIENEETNGVEITRHGKSVAVLGKKSDFTAKQDPNPFAIAYENFRNKLSALPELSESEWNEYFNIPRQESKLRHPEDFE